MSYFLHTSDWDKELFIFSLSSLAHFLGMSGFFLNFKTLSLKSASLGSAYIMPFKNILLSTLDSSISFNLKSSNLYKNKIPVHLTTSEQKLLNCFCKAPNKPFSREDIKNELGGNIENRSIDVAIARIRRKIEIDQRYPIYLQTVRGIGWMLQTHSEKINQYNL